MCVTSDTTLDYGDIFAVSAGSPLASMFKTNTLPGHLFSHISYPAANLHGAFWAENVPGSRVIMVIRRAHVLRPTGFSCPPKNNHHRPILLRTFLTAQETKVKAQEINNRKNVGTKTRENKIRNKNDLNRKHTTYFEQTQQQTYFEQTQQQTTTPLLIIPHVLRQKISKCVGGTTESGKLFQNDRHVLTCVDEWSVYKTTENPPRGNFKKKVSGSESTPGCNFSF